MRADEIREMGREDMETRVRELQEEQFRLKFRSATEPLEDPLRLRVIRRDIARLKTVLRETTGSGAGAVNAMASAKTTAKSAAKPAAKAKASAKTGGKRRTNA
ncbi:MAG TPA: 50S ribosomal protein L29 [Gemmatimonadaceae bacterium]|nr:50S ribosomal protein L29 [Gemmatimonadaceae bacterium]